MKSLKKISQLNNSYSKIKKTKRSYLRTKKLFKKNKKGGMDPKSTPNNKKVEPLSLSQRKGKKLGFIFNTTPKEVEIKPSETLTILESNIKKSKYIFVFDFDCTLSTTHSHGNPKNEDEYLDAKQVMSVNSIFSKIREKKGLIIILSRSIEGELKKNVQLSILFPEQFILGAKNIEEVGKGDDYWAKKKKITLNKIYELTDKSKEPIIMFYDDTELNITFANELKFIQSYHIPSQCESENKEMLLHIFNKSIENIP